MSNGVACQYALPRLISRPFNTADIATNVPTIPPVSATGTNAMDAALGSVAQTNVDREVMGGDSTMKSRASTACHSCRARKVKCSVVKSGIPYDNCRLYHSECTTSVSRRRKRFLPEEPLPIPSPVSPVIDVEEMDAQETFSAIDEFLATAPTSLDFQLSNHVPRVSGL